MAGGPDEYWRRHGLERDPFPASRDGWYTDDDLKRRLDLLVYLIQSGDPMVLVRGARGAGKSVLLSQFVERAEGRFVICAVQAADGFNSVRLLVALSRAFANDLAGGASEDLGERLLEIQRDGGIPLLLLDDVERLTDEALDTVLELYERMGESGRLLRVVLAGEPDAEGRLAAHPRFRKYLSELRTLDVAPLVERQVESYLAWCLATAGGASKRLFSPAQLRTIGEESGGLPGRIDEVARRLLGGRAATKAGGGEMNLSKLRDLDIKKVLTWSGVALLLLAILIFQGQINQMIQGDAAVPRAEETAEPQPIAIQRRVGEMPQGTLPDRVVRSAVPLVSPPVVAPPIAQAAGTASPGEVEKLEPKPLAEIGGGEAGANGAVSSPAPTAPAPAPAGGDGMPSAAAGAMGPEASAPEAMAGDPLAGAPLEHRIPHLEKPTPFTPSEPVATPPTSGAPEVPAGVAQPASPAAMGPGETSSSAEVKSGEALPMPAAEQTEKPVAGEAKAAAADPSPSPAADKPAEAAPEEAQLRDEEWLMQQPPGAIAVQVLGGGDREALVAFARKHGLVEGGALFHGDNHGQSWYGLLSGVYPDVDAARRALKALPPLSAGYEPWSRSIASVQKEIEKSRH
ncbi:AAA family ATPase [Endothiovibrio diazotrophicus]